MILFKKARDLARFLEEKKSHQNTIGFVPTMGALHAGHLSLINLSHQQNDFTVCSIFVNPTQFNNPDDLKHYPVTIEKDMEQLLDAKCNFLFLPSVKEIYPSGINTKKHYNLGNLESILEGHYRPGHFQGVCQVVDRLLKIVQPNRLYLGQKDFQQCMVIKRLLEILKKEKEIELVIGPTVRETDGLAMSSRNLRLNNTERQTATTIFKTLSFIKENLNYQSLEELKKESIKQLKKNGFAPDYIEIANAETLAPASVNTADHQHLVALVAATLNHTRLIDNLLLN